MVVLLESKENDRYKGVVDLWWWPVVVFRIVMLFVNMNVIVYGPLT